MTNFAVDLNQTPRVTYDLPPAGPNDRQIQEMFEAASKVASGLRTLAAGGASHFALSERWSETSRTTYETAVSAALTAVTTALNQLYDLTTHVES